MARLVMVFFDNQRSAIVVTKVEILGAPRRPLMAQGTLVVTKGKSKCAVYLKIDLARIPGHVLNGFNQPVLAVHPDVLPGYTATGQEDLKKAEETLNDQETKPDRLVGRLIDQSIEALGLKDQTLLELWNIEITTVRELLEWSERDLSTAHGSFGGKLSIPSLHELLERLNHFGLTLSKKRKFGPKRKTRAEILLAEGVERIEPNAARKVLGDEDFELFERMTHGNENERVNARNKLLVKHSGLAWKVAIAHVGRKKFLLDRGNNQWIQYNKVLDKFDLFQEGCLGLLRALECFDHLRGGRFSTYAMYWIRTAVSRCINKAKNMPEHVNLEISRFRKARRKLTYKLGREPTDVEIAAVLEIPTERVRFLRKAIRFELGIDSLDREIGHRSDENAVLADFLPDRRAEPIDGMIVRQELEGAVREALHASPLLEAERRCLDLYYGLSDGTPRTLEQVSQIMGLSRERIRQRINAALLRLRTESTYQKLSPHVREARPFSELVASTPWQKAYEAWQIVRTSWEPTWSPGIVMFNVCHTYGVALHDVVTGDDEQKALPLGSLLMTICRAVFNQSFAEIADRFRLDELTVRKHCKDCRNKFLDFNPLLDSFDVPVAPKEEMS